MSRIRILAPLVAVLALSSCTPQQFCITNNTTDIRRLDRMIAATETNLARGYRFEEFTVMRDRWVPCGWGGGHHYRTEMCLEPDDITLSRPVPIDPVAERRKLDNLKAKRTQLVKPAEAAIAACKRKYPQ